MFSYLIIWISTILILFPRKDQVEIKSLYSLLFASFSFAQALLGFISLIFISLGISKFPILISAFFILLLTFVKTKNSLDKLINIKKFIIREINDFFLEKSNSKYQKILFYISLILLILIIISSLGPINHPDAADYHVGYPFQYYLRGEFFIDVNLHQ